jgi:hypothetical protein
VNIKVHGGTRSGSGLCYSCQNSHVRRGAGIGQEVVLCQAASYHLPPRITYPIVSCNEYRNRNLPSLGEMTKIATFINSDRRSGTIGFSTPDQDRKNNVERDIPDSPFDN